MKASSKTMLNWLEGLVHPCHDLHFPHWQIEGCVQGQSVVY
jgi:hypothetical protein